MQTIRFVSLREFLGAGSAQDGQSATADAPAGPSFIRELIARMVAGPPETALRFEEGFALQDQDADVQVPPGFQAVPATQEEPGGEKAEGGEPAFAEGASLDQVAAEGFFAGFQVQAASPESDPEAGGEGGKGRTPQAVGRISTKVQTALIEGAGKAVHIEARSALPQVSSTGLAAVGEGPPGRVLGEAAPRLPVFGKGFVKVSGEEVQVASLRPFFEGLPVEGSKAAALQARLSAKLAALGPDASAFSPELEAAIAKTAERAVFFDSSEPGEPAGVDLRQLKGRESVNRQPPMEASRARAAQARDSHVLKPPQEPGEALRSLLESQRGGSRQASSRGGGESSQEGSEGRQSRQLKASPNVAPPTSSTAAAAAPQAGAENAAATGKFAEALAAAQARSGSSAGEARAANAASGQPSQVRGQSAEQVFNQIVRSARLFNGQDGSSFEIRLKPEFLGRVHIDTRLSADNTLTTRFLVEDAEVRALLESRLPALADKLGDGGVKIESVEVQSMNSNDAGRSQADGQQQRRGAEARREQSPSSDAETRGDQPDEELDQRPPRHGGRISLVA